MADAQRAPGAPRGYMRRDYHRSLDQLTLQFNWSLHRKQRHRRYNTIPPPDAHAVDWTDQVTVTCAECRRRIGKIVAFHSDDRYGIVEDTARWYPPRSTAPIFTGHGAKHPPWLWIEGNDKLAIAHFRCPRCHDSRHRNAHRLGQQIVQQELREVVIPR